MRKFLEKSSHDAVITVFILAQKGKMAFKTPFVPRELNEIHVSDPADKEAIDEAERHALQVIPEGSSLLTFFVYAFIPESIRFALNITVYAR